MGRVKGTNIAHVQAFVAKELGEPGLAAVREALKPEARQAFDSFMAVSWYPGEIYVELLHALESTVGAKDPTLLQRAGVFAAEYDLTRIHRVLFRFANPAFVLEKSMDIWHRFFDTGKWEITRPSPTSTLAFLQDFALVDRAVCVYMTAYLGRLFELVGAKEVVVHHLECRARGAKACKYAISWA